MLAVGPLDAGLVHEPDPIADAGVEVDDGALAQATQVLTVEPTTLWHPIASALDLRFETASDRPVAPPDRR